jgi:hypothetical protein
MKTFLVREDTNHGSENMHTGGKGNKIFKHANIDNPLA